jgi:hypothetical protein
MSLYGSPKTKRERLMTKKCSIQSRLNRGGLDPEERVKAQAALKRVETQLAGESLLPREQNSLA